MLFGSIIMFSVTAISLILTSIRTPIWMIGWLLILGISLYIIPGPAKVVAPVIITLGLFFKKGLDRGL